MVSLADPSFFIDSSEGLNATYAGYTVRSGTSAENSIWMKLDNFTGGSVSLAPGQTSSVALPNIAPNSSATSYMLLAASSATTTPQSHTMSLYRGYPAASNKICERSYSYHGVYETIKALANKVTSVNASVSSEAKIGDSITVTVTGNTGTLGAGPAYDPGVLSYAPNALGSFPASAWRLEKTSMAISPNGVAGQITYIDRLYLAGASGPNRPYTANYTFRAVGPSATAASVKPIQYIASGTQVKHTDMGGVALGSLPSVSSTRTCSSRRPSPTTYLDRRAARSLTRFASRTSETERAPSTALSTRCPLRQRTKTEPLSWQAARSMIRQSRDKFSPGPGR